MTGVRTGVATRIKQENPKCLLTHCYCHALNLAIGDTVKNVQLLKEVLDTAYELTKLVKYSPKRQAALKTKQEELKLNNVKLPVDGYDSEGESFSRLRLLCPTRWTVRAKALWSISNNSCQLSRCFDGAMNRLMYQILIYVQEVLLSRC